MTTSTESTNRLTEAGREYVDDVAAQLDDLPRGDREELLSDAADAIAELGDDEAAASRVQLLERLGDPVAFADELRRSAGAPERTTPAGNANDASRGPSALSRAVGWTTARLAWLGREFESAWWILRGAAIAYIVAIVFGLPQGASIALLLVAVVGSVVLGYRSREARTTDAASDRVELRRGIGILAASVVVLAGISAMLDRPTWDQAYVETGIQQYSMADPAGLTRDGMIIENLYTFDAAGERVANARIYDQHGESIDVGASPDIDPLRQRVVDAEGDDVLNAFPIRYVEPDTGAVADPDAGWPASPGPLSTQSGGPSTGAADAAAVAAPATAPKPATRGTAAGTPRQ